MVKKYIKSEELIVLAVVPAMDDFGNAEALHIVKEENAESRCIGIVTKCDMVPKIEGSSDIVNKIQMSRPSDIKLDLGFIAVRNRGPTEGDASAEELKGKEEEAC